MKGVCPGCGFAGDLEAFLSDAQWRAALVPALALPAELAPYVLQYLRLFSPAKQGLRADRAAKILVELAEAVGQARVNRGGVQYIAPVATWKEAMEEVFKNRDAGMLTLPLKTHGYLYQVVAGLASRAQAQAEQKRIAGGRGETPVGRKSAAPSAECATSTPPAADNAALIRPTKRTAPVSLADTLKSLNVGGPLAGRTPTPKEPR